MSDSVLFYCYTTPEFKFTNLTQNQEISSSSYKLNLSYSQTEGELLNSYLINLYDYSKHLIHQSGVRYNENLDYTIAGLEDEQVYFVQAIGETVNNTKIDTGLIKFTIKYTKPTAFSLIELINLPQQGCIRGHSNIISIVGTSNPNPATYIDNQMVDLTASGTWVQFDENFKVEDNFTIQVHLKNAPYEKQLIVLENNINKIEIMLHKNKFNGQSSEIAYLDLTAFGKNLNYYLVSNFINVPLATDMIQIWIRRINNYYELKLSKI